MENLFKDCERKMNNSLDHLRQELSKLRTGSANGAILDGIKVDYYGTPTPLSQLATLGVPDSQTITIQPYDVSILKDLEKAISGSDLGLTPNNDGNIIRLPRGGGGGRGRWRRRAPLAGVGATLLRRRVIEATGAPRGSGRL